MRKKKTPMKKVVKRVSINLILRRKEMERRRTTLFASKKTRNEQTFPKTNGLVLQTKRCQLIPKNF